MRTEAYEAVESYLKESVPALDISIGGEDALGVTFEFRHEITGIRHRVRVTMQYLDSVGAEGITTALRDLRLSEQIERAGGNTVTVAIDGVRIEGI